MAVGFGSVGIVIGVPSCGRPTTVRWAINLAAMVYPLNTAVEFCAPEGIEVGEARDYVVQYALERKARYVWFIDDDVLPPNWAAQRLISTLRASDAMACGGIYPAKRDIYEPLVFQDHGSGPYYDWKPNEVFEVTGFIGTGCLMIKTALFHVLEPPWFVSSDYPRQTDDNYFCQKVLKAGHVILADAGVLCGHFDWKTGKGYWAPGSHGGQAVEEAVAR